jgi:hypothetical protein
MGSTKHEKSFVDFEQPYEQNIIGLKGIVIFAALLLLFIITGFFLMWALENVLEQDAVQTKGSTNPLALTERDRLPPEPRLQLAPGFGVESENGRVNLELLAPQAEYWELEKQWKDIWEHGQKNPATGAITSMSIKDAKEKFLTQQVKARSGPEAEQALTGSKMYFSDSSSGRRASEKRR